MFEVPPSIMMEPSENIEVRKGTTVTLLCKGSGNPSPKISWTHRSNWTDETRIRETEFPHRGSTIIIDSANRRDSGEYQCTGYNGVGRPAIGSINLRVFCKVFLFLFFSLLLL